MSVFNISLLYAILCNILIILYKNIIALLLIHKNISSIYYLLLIVYIIFNLFVILFCAIFVVIKSELKLSFYGF